MTFDDNYLFCFVVRVDILLVWRLNEKRGDPKQMTVNIDVKLKSTSRMVIECFNDKIVVKCQVVAAFKALFNPVIWQ